MQISGDSAASVVPTDRGDSCSHNQRDAQDVQAKVHGIAWVLCQRLPDEFDNDSLFSIGWCDILRNNYFDGHNLKWVATMLNPDSDIARPASL